MKIILITWYIALQKLSTFKNKKYFQKCQIKSTCKTNKGSIPNLQPSVPLFPRYPNHCYEPHICSYLL